MWSGGYCSSANIAHGLSDGRSPLSLIIRAVIICRQEAAGAMDCGRGSGGVEGFCNDRRTQPEVCAQGCT